ncbi:flagellar basal-body rod protein [Neobacillus bataviensis LMG 21833]|uniref:Flagellar basal-body rod protein n=1 Tax=Neobacillus bataviensis LMG 21833 TaxID=1117379 RepID=K6DV80_9BACI|nr:flagellar hook-basal body protein [Neobacillus bataviensis]EKN64731.1 flagellar basal-body rod protein [Neobacillus bataviensis LMG 21833]
MLRGIDTAASGMIALQRRQESLTNNLANVETPGYKKVDTALRAFPEVFLERINDAKTSLAGNAPGFSWIGSMQQGVYAQENISSFLQGDLVTTNNFFDVAIDDRNLPVENGQKPGAFFAVVNAAGEIRYTRNGRFTVDEVGQLTTLEGYKVLNNQGNPIQIDPNLASSTVSINGNGEIIMNPDDPATRKMADTIGLALIQNPNDLVKEGNGVFRLNGQNPPILTELPAGVQLNQKMIERSTVDPTMTMTNMMENVRLYEANQKVLQAYDRSLELLNSIGRV